MKIYSKFFYTFSMSDEINQKRQFKRAEELISNSSTVNLYINRRLQFFEFFNSPYDKKQHSKDTEVESDTQTLAMLKNLARSLNI